MDQLVMSFKMALKSIKQSKLRSILTMLGIIVGTSSVITLICVMASIQQTMTDYVSQTLPTDTILVYVYGDIDKVEKASQKIISNNKNVFEQYDSYVSDSFCEQGNLITDDDGFEYYDSICYMSYGVNEKYINNNKILTGRNISSLDLDNKNLVIVITKDIALKKFGTINCIDKKIIMNNVSYTVIGVIDKKNIDESSVYLPKTLYSNTMSIYRFKFKSGISSKDARKIVNNELKKATKNYSIYDVAEYFEVINTYFLVIGGILVGIAAISLFVGGIGIMNITLVSVIERTKEIGIRKSLGAKNSNILLQFLIESATVSLLGGLIGIIFGILFTYGGLSIFGSYLMQSMEANIDMHIVISGTGVVVSAGVSIAIGIIFGFFPARKASKLIPVDALKYE